MAKKEVKKAEPTTEEVLKALIEGINGNISQLNDEFAKCLENVSAARRARKLTSDLTKQFKEFRAVSVDHFRK